MTDNNTIYIFNKNKNKTRFIPKETLNNLRNTKMFSAQSK